MPASAVHRPQAADGRAGQRLALALDLLIAISAAGRGTEAVQAHFLRQRKSLEPYDRGRLLELVDQVLRHRAALDWWLCRHDARREPTDRARLLLWLLLGEQVPLQKIQALIAAAKGFGSYDKTDDRLLSAMAGRTLYDERMPAHVQGAYPLFLEAELRRAFGDETVTEMRALAEPAPLDLRVNMLAGVSVGEVRRELKAEGLPVRPTPYSPIGLRAARRFDLGNLAALREGVVEPQDEGSQLAALLVAAEPGQYVVDYCAGSGGKTLAIGAAMENRGRLIAADVSEGRLKRARLRLRRAGVHIAECRLSNERKWLKRQAGRAHRVLVDAPCTGIGSWRRIPDARWQIQPNDLPELLERQRELLDAAARLVRPGGRLVYVTCSVLNAENEDQVRDFLARHPVFTIVPVAQVWPQVALGPCPTEAPFLQLTPMRHGTGGFFVAVLERAVSVAADAGDDEAEPAGEQKKSAERRSKGERP